MNNYKKAADYLPHQSPMILIDDVIDIGENYAICQIIVSKQGILAPFINEQNMLPAEFIIEMMAQTIGVWRGWFSNKPNKNLDLGLLLGIRGFKSDYAEFTLGTCLIIKVNLVLQDNKLANFDCELHVNNQICATAKINVYQPDTQEIQQIIQQGNSL